MKRFLDFADKITMPPLALICEYAMAANSTVVPFTIDQGFEWLDNRIISALYTAAEEEAQRYSNSEYMVMVDKLPITSLLSRMDQDARWLGEFYDFVEELNKFFHYHYGNLPFPDTLEDYDPFFDWGVTLLNPNTMILEITDADDIEQFTSIY